MDTVVNGITCTVYPSVVQVNTSSRTHVNPNCTLGVWEGGGVAVPNRLASLHMGVSLWVINDEVICGFKIKGNIVMEQCRVYPDQEELWTQRCHLRSTSLSAFPVWGRSSGPVLDTYG